MKGRICFVVPLLWTFSCGPSSEFSKPSQVSEANLSQLKLDRQLLKKSLDTIRSFDEFEIPEILVSEENEPLQMQPPTYLNEFVADANKRLFQTDLFDFRIKRNGFAELDQQRMRLWLGLEVLQLLEKEVQKLVYSDDQRKRMLKFLLAHELSHHVHDLLVYRSQDKLSPHGLPAFDSDQVDKAWERSEEYGMLLRETVHAEIDGLALQLLFAMEEERLSGGLDLLQLTLKIVPNEHRRLANVGLGARIRIMRALIEDYQ